MARSTFFTTLWTMMRDPIAETWETDPWFRWWVINAGAWATWVGLTVVPRWF